ncbi:MAG: MBL fold metallo-hydrolase [Endomicrobia bacterium]|nr:MBL fold metallo-hydrolase [Endomicrobiia bacterium]
MKVISLRSSSEANCFIVWTDESAIILDAGVSPKFVLKKLEILKIELSNLKGVLISHEHLDHSRYAFAIAERFNIPLYINKKTFQTLYLKYNIKKSKMDNIKIIFFEPNKMFRLAEFYVYPVPVLHDAVCPVGFGIKLGNFRVSYFLDIAKIDNNVWRYIAKSQLVIIDSNYDRKMLINGTYPNSVKKRIINSAHLSNETVANVILNHPQRDNTEFWLAHLSKDNNTPEVATKTIRYVLSKAKITAPVNFKILPQRNLGPIWSSEKYSQLSLPFITNEIKNIVSNLYSQLNDEQRKKLDSTIGKAINMKSFSFQPIKVDKPNEYAWKVTSSTDPTEVYVVARDIEIVGITGVKVANKVWSCECADFIFRCQKLGIPCKHILKLITTLSGNFISR